jgi:hypothetical protein
MSTIYGMKWILAKPKPVSKTRVTVQCEVQTKKEVPIKEEDFLPRGFYKWLVGTGKIKRLPRKLKKQLYSTVFEKRTAKLKRLVLANQSEYIKHLEEKYTRKENLKNRK